MSNVPLLSGIGAGVGVGVTADSDSTAIASLPLTVTGGVAIEVVLFSGLLTATGVWTV
jgi:hypothetical protein